MATAEQLDRVQALIKRLQAVGAVAPGVVISADAWNVLVDSVAEIARSLVELGAAEVPPHDHRDQVGLAWLDARLRALVEGGPLVEPAAQARLQDLEYARVRLDARLGTLDDTLGALRTETRDVKTRDLAREQSVNVVRRKLEGVADARDDVGGLRSTLDSIGPQIEEAVRLGRLLRGRGGQSVDVGALAERVGALEALREKLRFPSGEDFDAAVLDQRFAGLRAELVTEDELREAIEDLHNKGQDDIRVAGDRLTATVDSRVDERTQPLEGRLEELADARLEKVRELLPALVRDEIAPLEERVRAQAANDTAAAVAAAVAASETRLDARLNTFGDALRRESAAAVDALRDTLDARVTQRLDALLPDRLSQVNGRLGGLEQRVGALDAGVGTLQNRVGGLDARIEDVRRASANDTRALDTRLSALDGRVSAAAGDAENARTLASKLEETLDARATEAAKAVITRELDGMRDEVQRTIDDVLAGMEDRVVERFQATAADAIEKRVGTALRADMRRIATAVVDERIHPQ